MYQPRASKICFFPYLLVLNEFLSVLVDCRRLHHQGRYLAPDLVDAGFELSVNVVRRCTLFAKVVYLVLKFGVAIDYLAVSNQEL